MSLKINNLHIHYIFRYWPTFRHNIQTWRQCGIHPTKPVHLWNPSAHTTFLARTSCWSNLHCVQRHLWRIWRYQYSWKTFHIRGYWLVRRSGDGCFVVTSFSMCHHRCLAGFIRTLFIAEGHCWTVLRCVYI